MTTGTHPRWPDLSKKQLRVKITDFTKSDSNLERFCSLQNNLAITIETAKQQCFAKIVKKLSDPNTSSKIYWSILKCFLMGEKVSCIPPIFYKKRFYTDFWEKTKLYNSFFAKQCSLVQNNSVLPSDFELFTYKFLPKFTFTDNDIGRIISCLDPNKAHGNDMMSISMLKICGDSINEPLGLIFRACLEHEIFPQNWKKSNFVPIHKKTTSNQ